MEDPEVVLKRRVVPQPVPHVFAGGDCGACVLGGLTGKTVKEVYDIFQDGKVAPFHWHAMYSALWEAKSLGLVDRIITAVPMWVDNAHDGFWSWGLPSTMQSLAWFAYLQMGLDAGYYALALVDADKKGLNGHGTNHWVMLVGARTRRIPFENGATIEHDVLVSCSSTKTPDEEWVEVGDFLKERGGFNLLLARPTGDR